MPLDDMEKTLNLLSNKLFSIKDKLRDSPKNLDKSIGLVRECISLLENFKLEPNKRNTFLKKYTFRSDKRITNNLSNKLGSLLNSLSRLKKGNSDIFGKDLNELISILAYNIDDFNKHQRLIYSFSDRTKELALKLEDKDSAVRKNAVEELVKINPQGVKLLIRRMLNDPDRGVVVLAIKGLVKLKDLESIPLIREILANEGRWIVHGEAIDALAELNDKQSIPLIRSLLASKEREYIHIHAVNALAILGAGDKNSLALIEGKLNSKTFFDSNNAINALKNLGQKGIPLLRKAALGDRNAHNRGVAIHSLYDLDFEGNTEIFEKVLEKDNYNRGLVLEFLSSRLSRGKDISKFIPIINNIFENTRIKAEDRAGALWILYLLALKKGDRKDFISMVEKVYKSKESVELRNIAWEILKRLGAWNAIKR